MQFLPWLKPDGHPCNTLGEIDLLEQIFGDKKIVVIEIADIFLHQTKFEEIPQEDLEPEMYAEYEKVELRSQRAIIKNQLKKAKAEGYTRWKLFTADDAKRLGQSLGLNGMYLLVFGRKDAVAKCSLCDAPMTCECLDCGKLFCEECHGIHDCNPQTVTVSDEPEVEIARKVGVLRERMLNGKKR